jgi:hypothetical protein
VPPGPGWRDRRKWNVALILPSAADLGFNGRDSEQTVALLLALGPACFQLAFCGQSSTTLIRAIDRYIGLMSSPLPRFSVPVSLFASMRGPTRVEARGKPKTVFEQD